MPNNRTLFIRWYAWSLKYGDCDPAIWMTNYLNDRYEHNSEERIWLSWLYANTYYLPTSWVLKNEFPDYELATVDRLTQWNTANYKKLRYQTDTKYNKGHLPVMYESYKAFMGKELQGDKLGSYLEANPKKSFDNLWKVVNDNYYKFGRYTTWFYLQTLDATTEIKSYPTSLFLKDFSGSKSHRNGLIMTMDKPDWYNVNLTAAEYAFLEDFAEEIMIEMREEFPELSTQINPYTMETALCAFKKIFRKSRGRYLGYYLDRQAEEITKVSQDGWNGIEWDVLWQAREECLESKVIQSKVIDPNKFHTFLDTGKIERLSWMFKDEEEPIVGLEEFLC